MTLLKPTTSVIQEMDRPYWGTITEDFSANNAGMVEMPKQDEVPKKGYGHGKSRKSALGTSKHVLYISTEHRSFQ